MTVYIDDMQRPATVGRITGVWSHLLADTDDELHAFADRLGLKRSWHQKPGTAISHYDVTEPKRQQAIALGAVQIGYMSRASTDLIRRRREALGLPVHQSPRRLPFTPDELRALGRCLECGCHPKTQGHAADCTNQPGKREDNR